MTCSRILLAIMVLSGVLIGNAFAAAPDAGGFELPKYGEKEAIYKPYVAADGHVVIEFNYTDQNGLKFDFYDSRLHRRLFLEQETQTGNSNALQARLVQSAGLKQMHPALFEPIQLGDGALVRLVSVYQKQCEWPYDAFIQIDVPGQEPIKKMIFIREEETRRYQRGCSLAGHAESLKTSYTQPPIDIYDDEQGGFYAFPLQTPYFIHFDDHGNSTFLRGGATSFSWMPSQS